MAVFNKIVSIIVKIANFICIISIAVMMCGVVANVLGRYIFNKPISGITELTEVCWITMALSFGYVVLINGHTKVDVFTEKLKPLPRKIMNLFTDIVAFGFCGLVAWRTITKAMSTKAQNSMLVMLGLKEWIVIFVLGVSFAVAALAVISLTIEEWKGGKKVIDDLQRGESKPVEEVNQNVQ